MGRSHSLSSSLEALIDGADEVTRRRLAVAAAGLALDATSLDDDRAAGGLAAIQAGVVGETPAHAGVEKLAAELDERHWELQESAGRGETDPDAHWKPFRQARAATAIACAGDPDARKAAKGAAYEAGAAIGNYEELERRLLDTLS
jgi:hypothetical protein